MPSESFDLDQVSRVTAGAVGPPGHRTFYLQLSGAGRQVSLLLEKEQLKALAERLQELLPGERPGEPTSQDMRLQEPVVAMWRVGGLTLAYDEDDKQFHVSVLELVDEGDDPATGHFEATASQMRAFIRQALAVVAAGRPPCPLCGGPVDHNGGVCPRANGHHA